MSMIVESCWTFRCAARKPTAYGRNSFLLFYGPAEAPCPDTCPDGGYEVAADAEFRNGATNGVESHPSQKRQRMGHGAVSYKKAGKRWAARLTPLPRRGLRPDIPLGLQW